MLLHNEQVPWLRAVDPHYRVCGAVESSVGSGGVEGVVDVAATSAGNIPRGRHLLKTLGVIGFTSPWLILYSALERLSL
jgi:hypothetical protein